MQAIQISVQHQVKCKLSKYQYNTKLNASYPNKTIDLILIDV